MKKRDINNNLIIYTGTKYIDDDIRNKTISIEENDLSIFMLSAISMTTIRNKPTLKKRDINNSFLNSIKYINDDISNISMSI